MRTDIYYRSAYLQIDTIQFCNYNLMEEKPTLKQRCSSFWTLIASILPFFSIGKYNQGFYFKNRTYYSTFVGGLLTLILGLSFFTYSISLLKEVFEVSDYNLDMKLIDIYHWDDISLFTLGHFQENFVQALVLSLDLQMYIQQTELDAIDLPLLPFTDRYNSSIGCSFQPDSTEEYTEVIKKVANMQAVISSRVVSQGVYRISFNIVEKKRKPDSYQGGLSVSIHYWQYFFSQNGQFRQASQLDLNNVTESRLLVTFQGNEFSETDDIIGISSSSFKRNFYPSDGTVKPSEKQEPSRIHQLTLFFTPLVKIYERYPQTLVYALARIGGLLGIMKVFTVMVYFTHQALFIRDLKRADRKWTVGINTQSGNLTQAGQTNDSIYQQQPSLRFGNNHLQSIRESSAIAFPLLTEAGRPSNNLNGLNGASTLGETEQISKPVHIKDIYTFENFKLMYEDFLANKPKARILSQYGPQENDSLRETVIEQGRRIESLEDIIAKQGELIDKLLSKTIKD
ncbi:hypothetical protein FGO68_gene7143 [Halteria grandinella]|uniref:Uncharacterized protein n=1 Tax=Halteria grandinella TaxID=5974 RepID=A0A8J8NQE8_HALGN|nr:hypothetical protein FGO68_gene7143 [Halteria grandinella]